MNDIASPSQPNGDPRRSPFELGSDALWTLPDNATDRRVALAECLNRLHLTGYNTEARRQTLIHHALVGDLLSLAECLAVEVAQ